MTKDIKNNISPDPDHFAKVSQTVAEKVDHLAQLVMNVMHAKNRQGNGFFTDPKAPSPFAQAVEQLPSNVGALIKQFEQALHSSTNLVNGR